MSETIAHGFSEKLVKVLARGVQTTALKQDCADGETPPHQMVQRNVGNGEIPAVLVGLKNDLVIAS